MAKIETLRILDRDSVNALVSPEGILQAVREAFVLHSTGDGQVFPMVREALAGGGVFGIKSGGIAKQQVLGFKAAGFWPGNREVGSEPHQATIMLIDPTTGRPLCLIDGNTITTLRTGAAGALGLERLARPDSARLTVFGTGVQAAAQLDYALCVLPGLRVVRYLTADGRPNPAFEARFAGRCQVLHARSGNAAVAESDVVITATPGRQVLFDLDAVQPGTHLNCVGADTRGKREAPEGLLAKANVFVDDRTQAAQVGECQWASTCATTELGALLSGQLDYPRRPSDITLFDMTGLALQDLTVARLLFEHAEHQGVGQAIPWPW